MDDYLAHGFAQAKAINKLAGKPIVRYSPEFDSLVSWNWDEEDGFDHALDEAWEQRPDLLTAAGCVSADA